MLNTTMNFFSLCLLIGIVFLFVASIFRAEKGVINIWEYVKTKVRLIRRLFPHSKNQPAGQEKRIRYAQGGASPSNPLEASEESPQRLQALKNTDPEQLLTLPEDLLELTAKDRVAKKLNDIKKKLLPTNFHLQSLDKRTRDYLRLNIEEIPIQQWLKQVHERLQAKGLAQQVKFQFNTQHQELIGDLDRLATLLINSVTVLGTRSEMEEEPPVLLVGVDDAQLCYPLPDVEEGYIKQVRALRIVVTKGASLPVADSSYEPQLGGSEALKVPDSMAVFDQLTNGRIVKAHYGHAAVSKHTLLYVIPVNVKEVRPKDVDKPRMELGTEAVRANDQFKNEHVDAQAQERAFLEAVEQRSNADMSSVRTALEVIKWYHGASRRHSGEPFYLHPLSVAHIVLDYDTDEVTILGALLHDMVEDTPMLLSQIAALFGEGTAEVVDVVTYLQSIEGSFYKVRLSAKENIKMLERTRNTRGLYVKLADRMHNMRTIEGHDSLAKQKNIAQETLDFFVPVARRMQLTEAATQLEALCQEVLHKETL